MNNDKFSGHQRLLQLHQSTGIESVFELGKNKGQFESLMEYKYSSWPYVLRSKDVKNFQNTINGVHQIFYKAITLYFGNNSEAFSDFFGLPAFLYERLADHHSFSAQNISRHDIIIEKGVQKILEINTGSNLGGWELDTMAGNVIGILKLLDADWNLKYRFLTKSLLQHIANITKQFRKSNQVTNVLFILPQFGDQDLRQSWLNFQLVECHLDNELNIFCTSSPQDLKAHNNHIVLGDSRVDVILWPDIQKSSDIVSMLLKSQLDGKLCYLDSPLHTILGNKCLFSLLFDEKVWVGLSEAERNFVSSHIPWTATLDNPFVSYMGTFWPTRDLLLEMQEHLVLKRTNSFKGDHVHVGKTITPTDWRELVDSLVGNGKWIVQHFVYADTIMAMDSKGKARQFSPVWGAFDLGGQYRGNILRGAPIEDFDGIINASRNALCFLVLEEQPAFNKVII